MPGLQALQEKPYRPPGRFDGLEFRVAKNRPHQLGGRIIHPVDQFRSARILACFEVWPYRTVDVRLQVIHRLGRGRGDRPTQHLFEQARAGGPRRRRRRQFTGQLTRRRGKGRRVIEPLSNAAQTGEGRQIGEDAVGMKVVEVRDLQSSAGTFELDAEPPHHRLEIVCIDDQRAPLGDGLPLRAAAEIADQRDAVRLVVCQLGRLRFLAGCQVELEAVTRIFAHC